MSDFTVANRGVDPNGRAILATAYMWAWWLSVLAELDFSPTVVQGAFMSRVPGGGAADSAGYHDLGGCFDLRTWDLTVDQLETLVRTLRRNGAAAWRRDHEHGGFDPHLHFVLGTDHPLASGAAGQWQAYLSGHDGLAGNGPDYEWRPSPLVTTPPEDDMPAYRQWDQADKDALANDIGKACAAAVWGFVVDGGKLTARHVMERLGKAFDRNGAPK